MTPSIKDEFGKQFQSELARRMMNEEPMDNSSYSYALWGARWMAERIAKEFDYTMIKIKNKDAEKIRQLAKGLDV